MKILAIGAHPDDIEIFMYGILSIYKNLGNKLYLLISTDGALGGKDVYNNLIDMRRKETETGLKNLGKPIFLNIPDGNLGNDIEHKIIIKEQIDYISPDLIITHYHRDYHSDHIKLSNLVKEIISHYIPILYCDTMMGLNFNPDYYVDITKHFDDKVNAIMCHKSQSPKKFVKLAKLMNRYRAAQCNANDENFAEAYKFEKNFPFSDIRDFLPNPPKIQTFHIGKKGGFL